ncbi:MAG: Rne/Rng family ribonuclease, partial [Thermoanaerobaculia bacterium]|nr:Rne/Rng family ribonuclease [Thermoanaerobaculia bacterium]
MTRRMLINAQHPEELRIAVVSGSTLDSFQVEAAEAGVTRGNIYRGTIANIQPSLNAAFIDYGAERHGFLAIQDVCPDAFYHQPKDSHRPRIEEVLERGKPIVVQVSKESEGQKGAVLTTNLSLAGRYLVLTPFDETRGVSRKVEDEDLRRQLKDQVAKLDVPKGFGFIVRTNAAEQNKTALARDVAALVRLWKQIETEAKKGKGTKLLYSDQDLLVQALRDHLDASIEEVLIDDDDAFQKAEEYLRAFMPRTKMRLTRYVDRAPLFARYDLDRQIEGIYGRSVPLASGGSIVIDRTEALTAIDVNSGRSTKAATQEETAVNTNVEAALEVARQLRLRDLGGLVVVDFIDMRAMKNRRKVEKTLKDAMKADKARSSVGRISENGLLEINRQRIQQALQVRTHRPCPTCGGTGRIASPELVGLNLLRRIEARAAGSSLKRVRIALHPELADAFQNGRRRQIAALENEFDIHIEVIASPALHRPDQEIEWFERDPGDERPVRPAKPAPKPLAPVVTVSQLMADDPEDEDEGEDTENGDGEGTTAAGKRKRRRRGGRGRKKTGVKTASAPATE